MLFVFSAVLGQFVDASAVVIGGGRVIWSSVALQAFSLVKRSGLKLNGKKDYAEALVAGVALTVHWTTFFQAIRSSSVAISTITFSVFPLFLTFLELLFFHESLRLRNVVIALVLLVGVGITIPDFPRQARPPWAFCGNLFPLWPMRCCP